MALTHWFGTWNPHKVSFSKLGYFPEDIRCAVNQATRTRATSIPKVPSRSILCPHTALHLHFPDWRALGQSFCGMLMDVPTKGRF